MLPETIERRHVVCEVRADESAKIFIGRAVEYNQVSDLIYGYFTEEIAPGAFDESLRSDIDIYCSVDHDRSRYLGRLSSGTLKLLPDDRGIGVECSIGDYSYAKDLLTAIGRKDLRGMSFIFDVLDSKGETRDGKPHRIVTKANLYEVAFVFDPCYPETSAGVRMAFPIAGEQRALDRMGWQRELETYRNRLTLAKHSEVFNGKR